MWQNEQNELNILDIITILSFALQLQNAESHKIDQLRDEVSSVLNNQVKTQLDRIEQKVDRLTSLVQGSY